MQYEEQCNIISACTSMYGWGWRVMHVWRGRGGWGWRMMQFEEW